MMADRAHRVVPRLRADEVEYLERETRNVQGTLSRQHQRICPHLPIFHNRGKTVDGGPWWACNICAVGEHTDAEEWAERRKRADDDVRAERRGRFAAGFLLGVVVVFAGVCAICYASAAGWIG